MTDLSKEVCVVCDNGMFPYIAEAIAPNFAETHYWSPWQSAFPDDKSMQIGVGLPGVTRADYWTPLVERAGLFVFPDVYHGPDQVFLESLGKRVWGSRMSEELELLREDAKIALDEADIPIGKFAVCEGMDDLRAYLKTAKHVLVKFSFTRGDKETFHVENYELSEPELDDLEHRLGPRKNQRTFIVEDAIEPACEIAYDGYTVDGQWPKRAMWGVEAKGKAYSGCVTDYDKLPSQLLENNAKVAPMLKKWRCRSWFAMETRVSKNGCPWVIDPMCRFGNPPGALCSLMYTNLAEILWGGAAGEMVEPEFADKWGVQLQIYSDWSTDHWQPVHYPESISSFVKLQYSTVIDGIRYVVPTADKNPAVGSVVGTGGTLEEAISKASKYAEQVKGPGLKIDPNVLKPLEEEFAHMKTYGITI